MIDITCLLKSRQFLWRHVFKKKNEKESKLLFERLSFLQGSSIFIPLLLRNEWIFYIVKQTTIQSDWFQFDEFWPSSFHTKVRSVSLSFSSDNKNRRSTNVALTSIKNIKVLFYSEMIKLNYSKFILLNEILVLID